MQGKVQPTRPKFQKVAPPGTPLPMPDLSDMDKIHRLAVSGRLEDVLYKLAGGKT